MKKELLMATALASTMGMAGVAEAASATMSGHVRVGVEGENPDSSDSDTTAAVQLGTFSVSISETTDGGVKIASGFDITDESDGATDPSGLTLTFTDGSSLQLIEAGAASNAHAVSVPGAGGEQGIANTSANRSPTALTMGGGSDSVGFDYATAADAFGIDGFSANVSASFNDDVGTTSGASATATLEGNYSVGVTYVTTAGDSTVTLGAGFNSAEFNSKTATKDNEVYHIGATAVTGDLTVGVGIMNGDYIAENKQMEGDMMKAGVKYVSGDITFNVGMSNASATDESFGTAATSSEDVSDSVGASVDYAVASGVTATLGYTDVSNKDEGTEDTTHSGSAWYVGATMSF